MPLLLHTISFNLDVLKAEGCQLVEPKELFLGLCQVTMGDPCRECNYQKDCPAYLKYHSVPIEAKAKEKIRQQEELIKRSTDQSGLVGGRWAGMSIKRIAAAEGISLNEARRRKEAGEYK